MQRILLAFSFLSFFLLTLTATALADQFEEAKAAYKRGQYARALELFRPLAKTGDAAAQNNLGVMYANGQGVATDYAEAMKWLRKAAEQDVAEAQSNIGAMYYNGQGVDKDYAEAAEWYRKAALQGDTSGQVRLGEMYATGQGLAQSITEAQNWLLRALEGREAALYHDRSPINLGNASYSSLLTGRFIQAVETAREGLALDSGQAWIRINLAHALLLQGQRDEAMREYGQCRTGHEKALLIDFEILKALFPEKAGLIATAALEMGL
ncbi:MAG: sel1 repeat family protein [Deltaproteobacteria bacterium]|nr:sel1 repeat family protein [Deltaproteobacteria bacterium]